MSSSYHECAKKPPTCKGRGGGIKGYHACAKEKRCGKKFAKKEVGTKRQVYDGIAKKTKQGLKKEDLVINAKGNVVKKKGSRRQPTPDPEPVEEKKEEPMPEPEPEPEEKEPEPEEKPKEHIKNIYDLKERISENNKKLKQIKGRSKEKTDERNKIKDETKEIKNVIEGMDEDKKIHFGYTLTKDITSDLPFTLDAKHTKINGKHYLTFKNEYKASFWYYRTRDTPRTNNDIVIFKNLPEPEEKKEPEPEPEPEEEKKEPKPKKEKKPRAKKKKDIEVDDELRDILEDFIQDSIEARDNMKIKYDEARDRLTYETGERRKKYKEDAKFWKKRIKEQEKWLDVETDDEIRKWYKENTAHIESMRQRGRGKVIDAKCKKLFKDNNINTIKDFRKWALAHHPDKIQQRNPNMTEDEIAENNENYSIMNNCIEEYKGNLFKSQAREDRHAKRRSSRPQKKEERREPKTQGRLTYIKGGSLKLSMRTGTFFPGFSNPRLE